MSRVAINLKGRRFGLYKVLERAKTDGPTAWICRCKCGVEKAVNSQSLRTGKSLGCSKCRAGRPVEPIPVKFKGKVRKMSAKQLMELTGVTQGAVSQWKTAANGKPIELEEV